MRPTPNEVIEGVVRILRDTVAPAVGDDHARVQLAQVVAVLRGLDADAAAAALATRDAELVALLTECAAWIAADGRRAEAFADAHVAPAAADHGIIQGFAELNERHEANRAVLAAFIDRLRGWRAAEGVADSAALVGRIGAHLAGSGR